MHRMKLFMKCALLDKILIPAKLNHDLCTLDPFILFRAMTDEVKLIYLALT